MIRRLRRQAKNRKLPLMTWMIFRTAVFGKETKTGKFKNIFSFF